MTYQRYSGDIREIIPADGGHAYLAGLSLPALARELSKIMDALPRNVFVAVPTALEAEDLAGDLAFFRPEGRARIHLFPALEAKPFLSQSSSPESLAGRMKALGALAEGGEGAVLIASAAAALRLCPPAIEAERIIRIETDSELPPEFLRDFLLRSGYVAVGQVESRGDFSARGDIVDFFPPGASRPLRVEFFGDFVESIRSFRPYDQRSVEKLKSVTVLPVAEFDYDAAAGAHAAVKLERLASEAGWHELLWRPLCERLQNGEAFSGLESWAPIMVPGGLVSVAEHLKTSGALIYEPERFLESAEAAWLAQRNLFDRLALEERPHLPLESLYQYPDQLMESLRERRPYWESRDLPLPLPQEPGSIYVQLAAEANGVLSAPTGAGRREGAGLLGPLAARVRALLGRGFETHLVLRSEEQRRRLAEMLAEYDLSPESLSSKALPRPAGALQKQKKQKLQIEVGQLSGGFAAPYDLAAYIAEDEIFGAKTYRRRKSGEEFKSLSFAGLKDLSPGDFVVHDAHGIGQYQGLVTLQLSSGRKGDFLHLVYKGGDKLYVPVERFGAVSKYVGAGESSPAVDKLGGLGWEKLKGKVKEDLRRMADELLKLYAKRQVTPGHAFGERDGLFTEFEAAFEYDETPDQLSAIESILADLAADRPMDRLVCGDVGYGKTEVAMRAAFKVVEDKKQVAVLVPTTILAEQHGQTFEKRFASWPIRVASLSRFKKPAEQKKILAELAEGRIDVLVGTHRLLQKDVKFKDLGLVVIDEEHRFGVADKEKLKKLRTEVDFLSMSATPIPRSLSMSLAGIRDLSSIETPPQDRLAVETRLIKYEDEALCEAIDRELARGGQVFLVHNRVRDIHLWAAKLRRLMPLVKFGVGHGQMKEKELEEVMTAFLHHDIDVWITTTIVESGLDFPGANTIIIDQADRFGLAQLYQLRGRVGRGRVQAYAYLMVDNPDTLTSDAKKRLKAILDHSELGSGYQIAMHDLQIRGSGNILGAAQSGQASLVGYELYTQLMEEAISELKGEPYEEDFDPEVVMGLPAYLPEAYAPDTEARLLMYRRLSSVKTEDEITALAEEMRDRFGKAPEEARNLIDLMELKLLLKRAGVRRLETGAGGLTLSFGPDGPASYEKVMALVMDKRRKVRLSPGGKLFVGDISVRRRDDLATLKNFLPGLV